MSNTESIRSAEYGERALQDKNLDSSGTTFQTTEAGPGPIRDGEMYQRKTEGDHVTIQSVTSKWVFFMIRGTAHPEQGQISPEDAEAKVQNGEWTKTDYSEPQDLELIGSAEYREIRADLRKLAAFTKNEALTKQAALDLFNLSIIRTALDVIAGAILAAGDPKIMVVWSVAKAWVGQQERDLKKSQEAETPGREFEYAPSTEAFPYMS